MSYHVMALIPPGVKVSLVKVRDRLQHLPGIGAVEATDPRELRIPFDGWEMWVTHRTGDEIAEEVAEVVSLYGSDTPSLQRVAGSNERIDISVPEPPDGPEGSWFDFCWDTIEIVRELGDFPIFDAMDTKFVFE